MLTDLLLHYFTVVLVVICGINPAAVLILGWYANLGTLAVHSLCKVHSLMPQHACGNQGNNSHYMINSAGLTGLHGKVE
jgi:hypothetical protein